MFVWMLPMTPRTSVTLISPSGLRVSCITAATISSACASTAAFSFRSFSFRCFGGGGFHLPLMRLLEGENPLDFCVWTMGIPLLSDVPGQ